MKTVLVKYLVWVDGGHPMLDGSWQTESTITKVNDLLNLNTMFKKIQSVTILEVNGIPVMCTQNDLKNEN